MFLQTALTHAFVGMLCIIMGCLSYGAYGSLTQDIVFYNLPKGSALASIVALLYMLNIVGSISMTIQPIYGLIEKGKVSHGDDDHGEEPADSNSDEADMPQGDLELKKPEGNTCTSGRCDGVIFTLRRLIVPYVIICLSTLFPDVNSILSLIGGDICGVLLIVLPIFFYRAAYIERPSKKSRVVAGLIGFGIVAITLPIGLIGIYQNVQALMYN